MENNKERKNKYIGFRIGFNDYLRIVELCGRLNITITDFVLSGIYPMLDKGSTDVKPEVKQENNFVLSNLNKTENNPDATIEALMAKEKIINQKIKQLNLN